MATLGFLKIRRALISVSDKRNILSLAQTLNKFGVEIISTGGTLNELKKDGIKPISISSFTGFPEILDGRVKTLHPKVFGGILAKREDEDHKKDLDEKNIDPIDLVVVNLYPFGEVLKKGASDDELIENIDIGGVSLLRAAAKNYQWVSVVTNPNRYEMIIKEMEENDGAVSLATRLNLASEAFEHTAGYDLVISNYFNKTIKKEEFPFHLNLNYQKLLDLRYGENPHQKAAFYKDFDFSGSSIANAQILSGKELSYNNINDLDATLGMIEDFQGPFAAIVKHSNPCGAACAESLAHAYEDALACDPVSAFGCIIGLNKVVDMETAQKIDATFFVECCIAPGYEEKALELLRKKKNRRFLAVPELLESIPKGINIIKILKGGALVQTPDEYEIKENELKVVTETSTTKKEIKSLLFAWKIVKHIKSNAIVLVKDEKTVGIGAGQMSRVDSVIIATLKAGERAIGSVLASDAFFPMRDGVDQAAKAGVKAIIQPGGSKGDEEVIRACNEHKIAMVFTGIRHFRH
jgi:phosphoribosylaminoimidazolecarboxamide formyltransferase/IMP cyclohydrolase